MRCLIWMILAFFTLIPAGYAQEAATPPVEQPAAKREKIFGAEQMILPNGMQIVVIPNHRVPVVTHMVWYKVGAADEAPGQSGLAHFVEHLMFKGTKDIAPGEFSKRVKALGGNDNAFTGQDFTAYFQSIAAEHLETVMKMEADRMVNLVFDPAHIDSERLVVLEERRQRTENEPTGYFYEQMRTTLFPNHPYGNPVIGWLHEMEALSGENVRRFYEDWYAPNNAILIVSGDVTLEKVKPLAERIYGVIPARAVPARDWTKVPPLLARPRLVMNHPSIRQPLLYRLYAVPSANQNRAESLALEVLRDIMGNGTASRFYKSLVVEQKLSTNTGFWYDGSEISDAVLQISATTAADVDITQLEAAVDAEIAKLVEFGVTDEEVAQAKKRMSEAAILARDSVAGPAMLFGRVLATGGTIDHIEYWPYDLESVTTAQINEAARSYLSPSTDSRRPYVTGHILPENTTPAPDAVQTEATP